MYNRKEYVRPFRKGNTVVNENALVIEAEELLDGDGNIVITLLYDIETIISVTDFGGKKIYEQGSDYIVKEGKLVIPPASSMPRVPWAAYNPRECPNDGLNAKYGEKGGYLLWTEGLYFLDRQISVTYIHKVNENYLAPRILPGKLPKLAKKLAEKRDLTVCFWGDSITVGCNCSAIMGVEPYMPSWADMFCDTIREDYGCNVNKINKAVGGTRVEWGLSAFDENWANENNADIFVIAFGGNNGVETTPGEFADTIAAVTDKVYARFPDCEVIAVSVCQGNHMTQDIECHHLRLAKLYELADKYGAGFTVLPMTTMHAESLKRKKYWDMTANNINHPNDTLIRMYAQTLAEILENCLPAAE